MKRRRTKSSPSPPSVSQTLTENFYRWEQRGRGWEVYGFPVDLEPPFQPFFHFTPQPTVRIDDARKTIFGGILSLLGKTRRIPRPISNPYELSELEPESFDHEYSQMCELRLVLPARQKVSLDSAEALLLSLSYCDLPLSFELIGTDQSIVLQLACRESDISTVRQQLKAYFPEAAVDDQTGYLERLWEHGCSCPFVVDFGLSKEFMRPLRRISNLEIDPLIGITGALENLEPGEVGVLQVLFQPVRHPWAESIVRSVTDWEGQPFFADAPEMVPLAKEKIEKPLFAAVFRIAATTSSHERTRQVARALGGALCQLADPQGNELIPLTNDTYDDSYHEADLLSRTSRRIGMILNSEELVSLVHLPSVSVRAEKLVRDFKKTKAAPDVATGHELVLGENLHQGKTAAVSLGTEQRLRHMYVVGATGTGKSTLLHSLIVQDIRHGHGVAVLDPHGDLIDKIFGHIPEERHEDVILLDPSDAEYPVGLNVLSCRSEVEKNVLASDLGAVFKRLSTSWGDQMTSVLGNAILAFLENDQGGTLAELRRFLVEADFRKRFLANVRDPDVIYYWLKDFPQLTGRPQASIMTRLDTFLRPKLIRNMVSQKDGLNFGEILNGRKILLSKLSQGLIGEENAYLLGALIVSKIQQTAMARQAKAASDRDPFYLYIDEFQNFITPSMASILSGARKYGLGLILAHQELRQLWNRDTEVASSVLSNPGTRICFRLGDFDAQKLAEGFSAFDTADLQNLGVGEALCRLERYEQDFNLKTLQLPEVGAAIARERREAVTELSRRKYGRKREVVEAHLAVDRAPIVAEEPEQLPTPRPVRKVRAPASKSAEPSDVITVRDAVQAPTPPRTEGKGGPQHKYLQALIKRMAEGKGFRAVIEKTLPDGGSVDVSIEGDGKKIACEISETTSDAHELKNIEKCLAAGYEKVILISQEKKFLEKSRDLAVKSLKEPEQVRVLFLQPEELYFLLEEEAAGLAGKEERVKGYRVKTTFSPVRDGEKKTKREAVAKVILGAMRRARAGDGKR